MVIDDAPDDRFGELVAEFRLDPITDEQAYRSAIAILDRLFAAGECRSRGETAYFHELAKLAAEYEESVRFN